MNNIIYSKKQLNTYKNACKLYNQNLLILPKSPYTLFSWKMRILTRALSKYDCAAIIINRNYQKWYIKKILLSQTNIPTEVIYYDILPFIF